jgi:hypothetical protein
MEGKLTVVIGYANVIMIVTVSVLEMSENEVNFMIFGQF